MADNNVCKVSQQCDDDHIIIKKEMFEELAKCQLTQWIQTSLENREDNDTWPNIQKLYKSLLSVCDVSVVRDHIKSSIDKIYKHEYLEVEQSFDTHYLFFEFLKDEEILIDLGFLKHNADFMRLLADSSFENIQWWNNYIGLLDERPKDLNRCSNLYLLQCQLIIADDKFFNVCLHICSRECECLHSQIQEHIHRYDDDKTFIKFKHFCLSKPSNSVYSDNIIANKVFEYVFKRRTKASMLVRRSLDCSLPNVLIKICHDYMFIEV